MRHPEKLLRHHLGCHRRLRHYPSRPVVALLTLVPITAFTFLDARYLQLERRFPQSFDTVAAEGWDRSPSFNMAKKTDPGSSYWSAFFSWSPDFTYRSRS
ncbi:protein of unknown function [Bradyrhizobium sp. ORS 285]|nr:hypothetical protein BRAO285_2460003 [Bradyrhizobium sp. ORS 285]SMX56373.1 protein of unknown function [Bradyrhizobium sp. ORS 285]